MKSYVRSYLSKGRYYSNRHFERVWDEKKVVNTIYNMIKERLSFVISLMKGYFALFENLYLIIEVVCLFIKH